jgi:4-amino-4-deoxy-L-arabinose transferase-like glycosyltransferase
MERKFWILLVLVFLLGFMVRAWNLPDEARGWDEARHLNEARWFLGEGTATTEISHPDSAKNIGYPSSMKTLYILFVSLSMLVFGQGFFPALLVSLLFSLLTIPVFFLIGRHLSNEYGGMACALICALDPFSIFLSRSAMAETTCIFFISLAVFSYLVFLKENRGRFLLAAGAFSALAFAAKEIGLFVAAAIILSEVFRMLRDGRTRSHAENILLVLLPVILATAALWLFYSLIGGDFIFLLAVKLGSFPPAQFLSAGIAQSDVSSLFPSSLPAGQEHSMLFLRALGYYTPRLVFDYPLAAFLFPAGLVFLFRKRHPAAFFLSALAALPAIFLFTYPLVRERQLVFLVPALAAVSSCGLFLLAGYYRRGYRFAVLALLAALLAVSVTSAVSHPDFRARADYRQISGILLQDNLKGTLAVEPPLFIYYTGKESAWLNSWNSAGAFYGCQKAGCLLSIDSGRYSHIVAYRRGYDDAFIDAIAAACTPFAEAGGARLYRTSECQSEIAASVAART